MFRGRESRILHERVSPQNPAWGLPDIKTWRRNSLAHRTAREAIPRTILGWHVTP